MRRTELSGTWHLNVLHSDSTPPEAAALPSDIPMRVPGDIAAALLEEKLIEDPYFGRNELDVLWIGRTDWSLSTSLELNHSASAGDGLVSRLDFTGIDTVAEVLVNGTRVAESRNMFRRLRPEVTGLLKAGENQIEIIIRSPENYTAEAAANLPYPIPHSNQSPWQWAHRNLLRKVACHGGWDWGITLMTGGIYEPPILVTDSPGRIEYVTTRQTKSAGGSWNVEVRTEYLSAADAEVTFEYVLGDSVTQKTFSVIEGAQELIHTLAIESPDLWWPAGQGGQPLYTLNVTAFSGISPSDCIGTTATIDTVEKRIGFREVEVVVKDDEVGRSMFFRINGRDIFAKGANWIPVDAFPSRQTDDVYRRLLSDSAAANMNMIRLWGGGQYERDIFYNLCDELGLMIWHDMMFACSLFPTDGPFLAEVDAEVLHQVKRLMDHPSIVLWCGNNEDLGAMMWFEESKANRDRYLVDYDRLNEGVIGRAVKELDPSRTWWPSSPSAGEGDYSDCWHDDTKGDMHYWSVWHEGLPFESYYDVVPRFCSEFGFQSFPCERTVASFAGEKDRNLTSPVMRHHQKNNAGNTIILSTMARYFRMPVSLGDQLYLSQVQQAWAIRTAVDYWRANRPVSMGALYWQLNDNWPVASWASIEYDGTWKLLHYEARRFYAPMRISLFRKDGCLHVAVINDTPEEAHGRIRLRLMSFEGDELDTTVLDDLRCPAGTASTLASIPLSELAAPSARQWVSVLKPHDTGAADVVEEGFTDRFIAADWIPADQSVPVEAESLLLTRPRDCELAEASVLIRPGSGPGRVVLETDRPAFYVQAEYRGSEPASGRFSDAGFTLLPGRPVELEWIPAEGTAIPADLASDSTARHLRSTY